MTIYMEEVVSTALVPFVPSTKHFIVQEVKSLWILMQTLCAQIPLTEIVLYITGSLISSYAWHEMT